MMAGCRWTEITLRPPGVEDEPTGTERGLPTPWRLDGGEAWTTDGWRDGEVGQLHVGHTQDLEKIGAIFEHPGKKIMTIMTI